MASSLLCFFLHSALQGNFKKGHSIICSTNILMYNYLLHICYNSCFLQKLWRDKTSLAQLFTNKPISQAAIAYTRKSIIETSVVLAHLERHTQIYWCGVCLIPIWVHVPVYISMSRYSNQIYKIQTAHIFTLFSLPSSPVLLYQ